MTAMRPLKITWRLATPVIASDDLLHLDGVLAWARAKRATEDGFPIEEVIEDLPLERETKDGEWVWKASAIHFEPRCAPLPMIYRRQISFPKIHAMQQEVGCFELKRRKYENKAMYKNWQIPAAYMWVNKAEAWCIGDPDKVRELLADVPNLGKLARLDFGRVSTFEVEEHNEALEKWKFRNLPWPEAGYAPIQGCVRSPYWRRDHARTCWRPVCANL